MKQACLAIRLIGCLFIRFSCVKSVTVCAADGDEGVGVNEKILVLASFSRQDHTSWITSLSEAIKSSNDPSGDTKSLNQRLFNSSEDLLNNNVKMGSSDQIGSSSTQISAQHNRPNALSHVCWHRNISISGVEIVEKEASTLSGFPPRLSLQQRSEDWINVACNNLNSSILSNGGKTGNNEDVSLRTIVPVDALSKGPLLRKFKNSSGWQKLWITFAHSCLYFYKSNLETVPLASLPLLGYKIDLLSEEEKSQALGKTNVFKLAFKAHVYYFRAESRYTFMRWISVLKNAMIGQVEDVQDGES